MAEPIVLETMGPMACINKWLLGLYSLPTLCEMRAAIGMADTPELPIKGFTFPPVILHNNFATKTPPTVPKLNATNPRKITISVVDVKKRSAVAEAPIETATNNVRIFKK